MNHYYPDSSLNYVVADYAETGRLAAGHLADLGHHGAEIGCVDGGRLPVGRGQVVEHRECPRHVGRRGLPRAQHLVEVLADGGHAQLHPIDARRHLVEGLVELAAELVHPFLHDSHEPLLVAGTARLWVGRARRRGLGGAAGGHGDSHLGLVPRVGFAAARLFHQRVVEQLLELRGDVVG